MLTENRISTKPVVSDFNLPRRESNLVDVEFGGYVLNETNAYNQKNIWICVYSEKEKEIQIRRKDLKTFSYSYPVSGNITRVGLSFDWNMRPLLVYVEDGITKLYTFNSTSNSMTLKILGSNITNPCISIDDGREWNKNKSDIILSYQKNNVGIYYRQSRDNFTMEYVVNNTSEGLLFQTGLLRNYRYGFKLL